MAACIATECNTLISFDAAQQANKSCGSTLMDCLSLSQIHTTFCWGRCVMVKHHYCRLNESPVWVSPCGGPSRTLSGPAPSDTLDGWDNLHLSSWLSGLYCFRRSASSSSARARKTNICFRVQAGVICNRAALRFWFFQGKQRKCAPLDEGHDSRNQNSNNEFISVHYEAPASIRAWKHNTILKEYYII